MGQTVKSYNLGNTNAGTYELPFDLSSLNAGVYMINLTAGNSSTSQKLVITK
jgi:hypothetical protein